MQVHVCCPLQPLVVPDSTGYLVLKQPFIAPRHHGDGALHTLLCADGVCGWPDCRFVVLVVGTVVYGRGDDQHVEAHKATLHSEHPHLRWRGTEQPPLLGPVCLYTLFD